MNDFWARKLAQQQPPAPPQQSAPASSRAWWDTSAPVTPQGPTQAQYQQEAPPQTKAASARVTDRCPSCGSKDYAPIGRGVGPGGGFQAWRCFDCGYPVEQQFSGMASVSDAPVAGRTKQISHDGGGLNSNYQPQNTAAGRVT